MYHLLTDLPMLIVLLVVEILEVGFTKAVVVVVFMWSRL